MRRAALALVGLVLSFALLSAVLRAGHHYFYCEAMGMLADDPCAAEASDDAAPRRADADRSVDQRPIDCCQEGTFPAVPSAVSASAGHVPPTPLVAILPPAEPATASAAASEHRSSHFERWRAPPWPPGRARTTTMVFLT